MKYLILGGNAAGMSFAAKMRRNDFGCEIVVIEKNDYVSFGACGLPYFVGNYFDDEQRMIVKEPKDFIDSNIDLRINEEVVEVNHNLKEVSIKSEDGIYKESYDKLIISTGASPIVLNNVKVDYKKVFTITSLKDGKQLKDVVNKNKNLKIGIIGTGFIGLELMDSLYKKGHQITMYTNTSHIMSPIYTSDIVEPIEEDLKQISNLKIVTDVLIDDIDVQDEVAVKYKDNEETFDIVVMCIGFRPNTSFINDIEKLKNGAIITNDKCQTSIQDIYAIGDCATVNNYITNEPMYLPLATTANKLGRMLADYLASNDIYFKGMLGTSAIKILDYELGRVGLTEEDCQKHNIEYKTNFITDVNQTSYYPGQTKIIAKIIYKKDNLQILGVQMVGKKDVIGRIDAMAVAIHNKMTTSELGYLDFAYAPPFSRTWEFLNVVGNVSK